MCFNKTKNIHMFTTISLKKIKFLFFTFIYNGHCGFFIPIRSIQIKCLLCFKIRQATLECLAKNSHIELFRKAWNNFSFSFRSEFLRGQVNSRSHFHRVYSSNQLLSHDGELLFGAFWLPIVLFVFLLLLLLLFVIIPRIT